MGRRAMKTTSWPGDIASWRGLPASRKRRFTRFRTTALPTRLLTEKPKRLWSSPLGSTQSTNRKWGHERPSLFTRWNSSSSLRRYLFSIAGIRLEQFEGPMDQTVSLLRPFSRRALRTLRPPGVRMRARNPWLLLRFLFLGWYVRLGMATPLMDIQILIIPILCSPCQIQLAGHKAITGGELNSRRPISSPTIGLENLTRWAAAADSAEQTTTATELRAMPAQSKREAK